MVELEIGLYKLRIEARALKHRLQNGGKKPITLKQFKMDSIRIKNAIDTLGSKLKEKINNYKKMVELYKRYNKNKK